MLSLWKHKMNARLRIQNDARLSETHQRFERTRSLVQKRSENEKRFVRSKDREVRRVAFTEAPGGKRLGENNAAPPTLYTVCNPHAHTPCEMYARISLLRMHIRTVSREER